MSTANQTSQSNEPSGEATDPRIAALETELAAARRQAEHSERRAQIQRHLVESGTIDIDAATLLVEAALAEAGTGGRPAQPVAKAVDDLKRRKPVLFRAPVRSGGSGLLGGLAPRSGAEARHAAHQAAQSGDRRALLTYMRLKRQSA